MFKSVFYWTRAISAARWGRYKHRYDRLHAVDAYTVGCGVLATIEQWYPTREFNGTTVPHKRNSKVWPGLVTKEKTMKYPASAMCTVCVHIHIWLIYRLDFKSINALIPLRYNHSLGGGTFPPKRSTLGLSCSSLISSSLIR